MTITRTDRTQTWANGVLVSDDPVVVDVTAPVVTLDLHAKARQALAVNATFLALAAPTNAQVVAFVQRLARENSAIIRLLIGADLLQENTDT